MAAGSSEKQKMKQNIVLESIIQGKLAAGTADGSTL
jgi:hypothetical protein